MGTKRNPGTWDCYSKAKPDEPLFVLLARDASAPWVVEDWARRREQAIKDGIKPERDLRMVAEARECAAAMRAWYLANRA